MKRAPNTFLLFAFLLLTLGGTVSLYPFMQMLGLLCGLSFVHGVAQGMIVAGGARNGDVCPRSAFLPRVFSLLQVVLSSA